MSATLTPLRRFAGKRATPAPQRFAGTEADDDQPHTLPADMPSPPIALAWPPRRAADAAIWAGMPMPSAMQQAKQELTIKLEAARKAGWAAGVTAGSVRRTWYDVIVGLFWGAAICLLLIVGAAYAGWLTGRAEVMLIEAPARSNSPQAAPPAPAPHWSAGA